MRQVRDEKELNAWLTEQLRPGVMTNCPLGGPALHRALEDGRLWGGSWEGGLFLFSRQEGFWRLAYYVRDRAVPPAIQWTEEDTVLEMPLRPGDAGGLMDYWQGLGFETAFVRLRLERPADGGQGDLPPPPPVEPGEALALLARCFDRETGCLPDREALAADCEQGLILTRRGEDGSLAALLRAQRSRRGTELRHLAADPALRGRGLAGALTEEFTRRFGGGRCTVWVREDCAAPRHIYEKNGFRPDGWRSVVWIRKGR